MKENDEITTKKEDITVIILSIKTGLTKYEDVKLIKIMSKKYQLTIMKDYIPIVGEIEGKIEIVTRNDSIILENINGYYMHRQNKFKLFVKED